jgi:hypothetical protein
MIRRDDSVWHCIASMPHYCVGTRHSAVSIVSQAMTCNLTSDVYCVTDDSSQPEAAAKLPEEESDEPGPSRLQQEADKPAAQPLAVKAKKQKRRHSKQSPSDADVQAAESPAGTMATDAPAEEAAVASQMVQEPIEAVSQDANTEPKQRKDKKKKKKERHSEDIATGSQPDSAEDAAVPASAVVQDQPELLVTEDLSVQPDREEPADKLKKKKKKKKRHSDAGVDAQQPAAVSAAVVEPEMNSAQAEPAQEPAVKPKKKKKKKHKQDASVEPRPAGTTAVDTTAAATEVESAPETEVQQADVAVSMAAVVKPKKRKHKDGASKSQRPTAVDNSQIDAVEAGAPHAEAQEPEQPAVKPKRKRKSKVDATAAAEAADAPSDAPAAAATAKTPKAKKARAATAKESSSSTLPGINSWRANQARTDVKKGKFTRQEKDTLKQAALTYAQDNGLASDDFAWLLNKARTSGNRKDVAGAWQTIAQSLPHRTYKSVYACGTRMLSELNYQVRQGLVLQTLTCDHSAMTKCSACTIQAFVAWHFGKQTLLAYFLQPMRACYGS